MMKQDIRKVILSPYFYISIVLVAVFLYMGSAWETTPDFLYLYWCTHFAGMTSFVMPLLAGLATADIYCVERRDGYHYSMLMRSDVTSYCLSKIVVATLTGLFVALLGIAVYAVICMFTVDGTLQIATKQGTYQVYSQDMDYSGNFMDSLGGAYNWWGMLAMYLASFGLYSMMWPVMSLAVAVFTSNRYLVIAFPVLFVNFLFTITPLLGLDWFNPIDISGSFSSSRMLSLPLSGIPFQIGMMLLYVLVCGTIFRVGVGRSLK